MKASKNSKGFSLVITIITILVLAALATAGWYVWNKNKKDDASKVHDKTSQKNEDSKKEPTTPADPSEGGKYLVIKEWGVRAILPADLKGEVSYSLGEALIDPDNNQIQAAKISIKNDPAAGNECTITETPQGAYIDIATQILRVEKNKPFNTQRYKGVFKANVLVDDGHIYHLNYVIPDCAGVTTAAHVEGLQSNLGFLQKVK